MPSTSHQLESGPVQAGEFHLPFGVDSGCSVVVHAVSSLCSFLPAKRYCTGLKSCPMAAMVAEHYTVQRAIHSMHQRVSGPQGCQDELGFFQMLSDPSGAGVLPLPGQVCWNDCVDTVMQIRSCPTKSSSAFAAEPPDGIKLGHVRDQTKSGRNPISGPAQEWNVHGGGVTHAY